MYAYTAKSGVHVESTVAPYPRDTLFTALYGEYARWIRRALGKGK